ncbi:hypothetical protein PsorP6_012283 [Peronosclerospora sorghi]|uniref:Uncharacterized protein n=1 Tax=Peronosclerospora sorghi TaxID=230839 RepID=A0ACC0WMA2_9STRA|nr:hypothetical protein PsorP6_012283 [Peronosclerospora sorghi]
MQCYLAIYHRASIAVALQVWRHHTVAEEGLPTKRARHESAILHTKTRELLESLTQHLGNGLNINCILLLSVWDTKSSTDIHKLELDIKLFFQLSDGVKEHRNSLKPVLLVHNT